MIERNRLLSLGYYKKAATFTGNDKNKNYKVEGIFDLPLSDKKKQIIGLRAIVWPGPLCLASTADELKQTKEAEFSEEGLIELVGWMNEVTLPGEGK